ncbi:LysR family transcriptional regulator [Xanthomonas campestris pv. spermacoces]|uniref:LysR family transcriptional regulator n=1 Tax=Xanthomonas euvesicatoria TaxID=456327 RepID=UPI001C448B15|nr:LysR substrate-binding domain-containing protein [Xanthomonas euvesicatoria]MBV6886419.1 LysR family transcriptional regulator [Xanthomonas campestris pv. spermacoces]
MELRLLRYFVAVAEELHFGRAAERLNIEQSPLSRAMRDLEALLGVALLDRSHRQTKLTWAGQVLLREARRVLATLDQALQTTKSAAQGYQSQLRIAICDSLTQPRIASLLARSREEEPELEIRVFELPFRQQLTGLHNDLLDVCFTLSDKVNDGLIAEQVWSDPLAVIVPARHPLLAHAQVRLQDALKFPLVLCHPDAGSGCHDQLQAILDSAPQPLRVVDHVSSLGVMLTLVGAGYGLSFAVASQVRALDRPDIVTRPLAGTPPMLSTFFVRRAGVPSEPLKRFISRLKRLSASPAEDAAR